MRDVVGEGIEPVTFNTFKFKGGTITIPVQAWDLDEEDPPELERRWWTSSTSGGRRSWRV